MLWQGGAARLSYISSSVKYPPAMNDIPLTHSWSPLSRPTTYFPFWILTPNWNTWRSRQLTSVTSYWWNNASESVRQSNVIFVIMWDSRISLRLFLPSKMDGPRASKSKIYAIEQGSQRQIVTTVIVPVLDRLIPSVSNATSLEGCCWNSLTIRRFSYNSLTMRIHRFQQQWIFLSSLSLVANHSSVFPVAAVCFSELSTIRQCRYDQWVQ